MNWKSIYTTDTWRPKQNGSHFTDGVLKYILDGRSFIPVQIALKSVPNFEINNK